MACWVGTVFLEVQREPGGPPRVPTENQLPQDFPCTSPWCHLEKQSLALPLSAGLSCQFFLGQLSGVPHTGWPRATETYSRSPGGGGGVSGIKVSAGMGPSEGCVGAAAPDTASFRGPLAVFSPPWLVEPSPRFLPLSSQAFFLCVYWCPISPFYKDTVVCDGHPP